MDETFFNAGEFWDSKGAGKWNRPMGSAGEFETAGDHVQNSIDLNEQLIKNRPATFFMRVNSNAMSGAGIHKGDVVIVDRSLVAKNGKVVIAVVDGELLIRRLEISDGKKRLLSVGARLSPIHVEESKCWCWGVVTFVIHSM